MFSNLMYQEAGLARLSQAQISKLLNHHAIRVKSGNAHRVHLSPEQIKKYMKAAHEGKGHTLRFDPYQVANHQHLRGRGIGIHIAKAAGNAAVSGINAGSDYADAEIEKQDPKDKTETDTTGGSLKKFFHHVKHAVKPLAKPLMDAATQYAISQINPQNAQLFMNYAMEAAPYAAMAGVGVHKRRRGRPKKMHGNGGRGWGQDAERSNNEVATRHGTVQKSTPSGGSVGPAGYDVSGGKVRRRKSHKRKPALHFNL